jgi:hypothetical protein
VKFRRMAPSIYCLGRRSASFCDAREDSVSAVN